MLKEVKESEIKAASLKFVKERFGFSNLKSGEESDIDLRSHRISFEAGMKILLINSGFVREGKKYVYKK
jgi:hypothetical protein